MWLMATLKTARRRALQTTKVLICVSTRKNFPPAAAATAAETPAKAVRVTFMFRQGFRGPLSRAHPSGGSCLPDHAT